MKSMVTLLTAFLAALASISPCRADDPARLVNPHSMAIGIEGSSLLNPGRPYLYIFDAAGNKVESVELDPSQQLWSAKMIATWNQRITEAKLKGQYLSMTKDKYNGVISLNI